jgi:hypothetical protein
VRLPDSDGMRRWQATRPDGKTIALELATRPGAAHHGVAALELAVGDEAWSLTRDSCIHVRGPDLPPRSQPARSHSDAELLVSALGARGRDPIYKEALAAAVHLVEAQS